MRKNVELAKEQVLAELVTSRQELLRAADAVPASRRDEVFLGVWSARDLLAHLLGWDGANLEAMKDVLEGRLPGFFAHHDRDWRTLNAHFVHQEQRLWGELRAALDDSHERLVSFLGTVPASEFERDRGIRFKGWKVTMARLLQAEAGDERTHREQISSFLSTQPGERR